MIVMLFPFLVCHEHSCQLFCDKFWFFGVGGGACLFVKKKHLFCELAITALYLKTSGFTRLCSEKMFITNCSKLRSGTAVFPACERGRGGAVPRRGSAGPPVGVKQFHAYSPPALPHIAGAGSPHWRRVLLPALLLFPAGQSCGWDVARMTLHPL